ncbi:MAG: sugar transferase [Spirochaetaceae bacterium]|nr:sugar transferase [Spirochaetaceae bacterium]
MHGTLKKILLLCGDVVLLYGALFTVLYNFYDGSLNQAKVLEHVHAFTILFVVWELIFYIWNLYDLNLEDYINSYVKAITINVVIAIIFFYIVPYFRIAPKTNLLFIVLTFSVFFVIWRAVALYFFNRARPFYQLVLVGIDQHMKDLAWRVLNRKGSNYSLHTVILLEEEEIPQFILDQNVIIEKDLSCLKQFADRRIPVKVVVSDTIYPKIFRKLYEYLHERISFYFVASFWEEAEKEVPIYATNELWFLDNLRNESKHIYGITKRGMDIFIALLFMPLVLVVYILAGVAIKINSPGPVVFTQQRVGRNGANFRLFKLRSMYRDAEKDGKAQWSTKGDSRITGVGKFLRRTRLDELPQVINVLRGEMSFIGPRPERPEFVHTLSERIPHYGLRHLVRPGLTGWAQVNFEYASSEEETAIKLSYDLYYVKNRSALLDIKIALKTILVIFERRGR